MGAYTYKSTVFQKSNDLSIMIMYICLLSYLSAMDRQESSGVVAKLVDVLALGASGVTHGGSSPLLGTRILYSMKKVIKEKTNEYEGVIRVTGKGVGYFPIPDVDEDLEIQPENLASALNRDRVKIKFLGKESFGRKQAKVVDIIERHKTSFVGTLEKSDEGFFLVPDDKRMYRDIFIPKEKILNAKEGEKVQAKIT